MGMVLWIMVVVVVVMCTGDGESGLMVSGMIMVKTGRLRW